MSMEQQVREIAREEVRALARELVDVLREEGVGGNGHDERLALTVLEAADLLGLTESTVREAVRTGGIPSIRFGRFIRIPRYSLEQMLLGNNGG